MYPCKPRDRAVTTPVFAGDFFDVYGSPADVHTVTNARTVTQYDIFFMALVPFTQLQGV